MSTDTDPRETLIRTVLDLAAPPAPAPEDLGWLGRLFGGRYASSNIVGLVIMVAFILLFCAMFFGEPETASLIITGAIGVITLSLGYLFGSSRVR